MDQQIKKIHNAVFVSDRIITYKVAAALLEVEVNEAKKALDKYVNDQKNKNEVLNVSYILGGVTYDDSHKVMLVPQIKYEKTKSLFKTINIDHIYSIQKSPLADWSCIANVDDFLYDKKDTPAQTREVKPKAEPVAVKKEVKSPPKNNKKGALSNFFNNANNKKKTENKVSAAPKTVESKNKKQEKTNAFTNYFNKGNKENVKEKEVKKESKESDDDEEIFKVNKKRTRVLNDEEDDDNPSKCPKVDILDDPEEVKEEYHSDEDLFGSPEKDEELMKDTEESEMETENSLPEQNSETTESTEKNTETTEENTETTEENTEKSETMYEDDDGYFVTEKKKPGSKQNNIKPEKQMSKKEVEAKKKIEKEETKSKKEVTQKIKNNVNQKTLFSFFQKK